MVAAGHEPPHPEMAKPVVIFGLTPLSVVTAPWFWQVGRMIRLIALLIFAGPAMAETPMTGAEFDAYSKGKTFYYGSDGQAYGVEQYLDDRRVRWSFLDGKCSDGYWYEQDQMICFVYENSDDIGPQCWTFFEGPGGLVAQFNGNPQETTLYQVNDSDEPMMCLGPEVGV